jgi:hypothetical protein
VTARAESLTVPGRRLRARTAVLAAGSVTLAALLVAGVVQFRRAEARLAEQRSLLEEARADLRGVHADLDRTQHRIELTDDGRTLVGSEIDSAVAARTWIDGAAINGYAELLGVNAARRRTDTARLLVAAGANEANQCFGGVSRAVSASHSGDRLASIEALQGAAEHCDRTRAYATGARFPYNFADPFVLRTGGGYYGYSTNSGAGDIQVIRSTDLETWELVGNGLVALPGWASPNATWAPAVLERQGRFVVYYTVRHAASGRQCISRGVASTPAGPFVDDTTGPLVCQLDQGGSIDPSPFVDADGRAYLLWKSEGRTVTAAATATSATIWSQPLSADGLALTSAPRALVSADRDWEHGVVEAPTMVGAAGRYFLVYSAASWNSRGYASAYATCAGPAGPCTKPADGRVLTSGDRLAGPGGVEVFRDGGGGLWAAFHAYSEPNVGYPNSRYFYVARLRVVDGRVVVDAAT